LAKVAILPLNFHTKHTFQIYEKLSYEALNRHFCQTAVSGSPFLSVCCLSVHFSVVVRWLGGSFANLGLCVGFVRFANVPPKALAILRSLKLSERFQVVLWVIFFVLLNILSVFLMSLVLVCFRLIATSCPPRLVRLLCLNN
jgi:Mg2+/Co2+ transporter CorB